MITASIGSNAPQRYVWTLVMALHTGPKLILAAMNQSVYTATSQVPPHVARSEMMTDFLDALSSDWSTRNKTRI